MTRLRVDKIASVTRNLRLQGELTLGPEIQVRAGAVLAGRIHGEKSAYNLLEDCHGRMSVLHDGDLIVGALGHRNALQGYEGVLPERVSPGDRVHLLNLGGVLGRCVSSHPEVGAPFEVEVLGQVLHFPDSSREGRPAHIGARALPPGGDLPRIPVVYVAGTCMNAGKTLAASALVRTFSRAGLRVAGVKLTGVSLMRDILSMRDYGARMVLDFTDAGVVCTAPATAPGAARAIFAELGRRGVDVVVAETGDGIMGEYGVQAILGDPELRGLGAAFLLCANDPVGAAGGVRHLREAYGIQVDALSGPATDNQVGVRFAEQALGLAAVNARSHPGELGRLIQERMGLAPRGNA